MKYKFLLHLFSAKEYTKLFIYLHFIWLFTINFQLIYLFIYICIY